MTRNLTAEWLARQITEVFPWDSAPKYLIRDNDRAFAGVFKARVRAMGIRDRPTSFRAPWQNGYIERLIGSIRRECTDHLIVVNAEHFREFSRNMPAIMTKCELTFRAGGRALHSSDRAVRRYYCASGSLVGSTIDTHESEFSEATAANG